MTKTALSRVILQPRSRYKSKKVSNYKFIKIDINPPYNAVFSLIMNMILLASYYNPDPVTGLKKVSNYKILKIDINSSCNTVFAMITNMILTSFVLKHRSSYRPNKCVKL